MCSLACVCFVGDTFSKKMRLTDQAVQLSLAASLAYLTPAQQFAAARRERRHTGPFTADVPGQAYASRLDYAFVEQVLEPRLQASASIFESKAEDAVCVAFRGSTSLHNFRSMFALQLVPLDGSVDGLEGSLFIFAMHGSKAYQ